MEQSGSHARCVLVTGVSRGIGRAVALRLAGEGMAVAGCWTTTGEAAEETRAQIEKLAPASHLAQCDVRDAQAVEAFVAAAEHALGPLDTLVNNAGIVRDSPMVLMSEGDWQAVVDVNLTGTWNVCRAVAFRFMKRRAGAVVNMSSVAGLQGNVGQSNYAATKAGIIGLSLSMAKELAPYGVRVNVVAPGFIETDMTAALKDKQKAAALERIPLRRLGTVEDVAGTVAFLISPAAGYITGQVLQVDGGIRL